MKKITPKNYALALYEVLEAKESKERRQEIMDNFLKLVWKNKDWRQLNKILTSFTKVISQKTNSLEAEVVSVRELTKISVQELKDWLISQTGPASRLGGRKVVLKERLEPDLLGGLIIKYEDRLLDLSLKTQLQDLYKHLTT